MPIVHGITNLYQELYYTRGQIAKIHKFGLFSKIENIIIDCLELAITAALTERSYKSPLIKKLKIQIEVVKKLIRLLWELKIINDKKYLLFSQKLVEISKMASGWIKYLNREPV